MKNSSVFLRPFMVFFVCFLVFVCSPFTVHGASYEEQSSSYALDYLAAHQLKNGAIHEEGDESSRYDLTSWAIMSFASAGFDPALVKINGEASSLTDYLISNVCLQEDPVAIERSIIALKSYDFNLESLPCDLIAKLDGFVLSDGSVNSDSIASVFGIMAYKAANQIIPTGMVDFVLSKQNADGGFEPYAPWGTESTFTAQTIQALIAGGVPKTNLTIIQAKNYLKNMQVPGGGFKYQGYNTSSNSGSSAAALMAIYSLGEDPQAPFWLNGSSSAIDDLLGFQKQDGSFRYDSDPSWGDTTPIFSTAYGATIMALNRQPLPFSNQSLVPFEQKEVKTISPTPTVAVEQVAFTGDQPTGTSIVGEPLSVGVVVPTDIVLQAVPTQPVQVVAQDNISVPSVLGATSNFPSGHQKSFPFMRLIYLTLAFGGAFMVLYIIGRFKRA